MTNKDGGVAFPALERVELYRDDRYVEHYLPMGGMSLRDYFAAKALVAYCSVIAPTGCGIEPNFTARRAYELADAMLTEREKATR